MTLEKKPLSALERKRLVAQRRERSVIWRLVHMLASMKLALFLLATIAIACAVATFYESSFNAKIAAAYIYKAPWFVFWLALLCINLFAVTLSRWPWEKRHAGFIITHYGIITVLIGAVVGSKLGFEGNVTLNTNAGPVDRITTSRSVLQVESPSDRSIYLLPFDAEVARPSESRPKSLAVPGSDFQIVTTDFSDQLQASDQLLPSTAGKPGIELEFTSETVGSPTTYALAIQPDGGGVEEDFFGLARVAWLPKLPIHNPPQANETRVVFAKFSPVNEADGGSTGVDVTLSEDGSKVSVVAPDGTTATYRRTEAVGKSLTAGTATVHVDEYWPDFVMKDGVPSTASQEPKNPAILVRIEGIAKSDSGLIPALELAPLPAGDEASYQLVRNGEVTASGTLKVGDQIELGWNDWVAEIKQVEASSVIDSVVTPGPGKGVPGFLAHLRAPDGSVGEPRWIESGSVTSLTHPKGVVRLGYGLELRPVPFSIELTSFEVPRFEGTETPSNFISTVLFRDANSDATKEAVAKMNHPASWPGTWFGQLTGLNYKFSQAEWNPRDLGETTLQVLYDPGWLLKWLGSLAICVGIFMLFYMRPARQNPTS